MYASEEKDFQGLLDDLGAVYSKSVTNELRSSYWRALKDQPFQLVKARAESHKRFGKFFPKPVELRGREEKPKDVGPDPAVDAAKRDADRHLDELWEKDRAEWLRVVGPKVREMGLARGMPVGLIENKLANYRPCAGKSTG